jgi:hypothetical protein
MKTKVCMLLICLFAVAGLALAQAKVDGKWNIEITTQRGTQMQTLTLKTEGGKITGTVEGMGRGGPTTTPIEDGALSGSTLTFKTKQMGRGGEQVQQWTGAVSGDEIKFKREVVGGQGMPQEFTAKRAK